MSSWTDDELRRVGGAEELQVASYRRDGSLRPYVTIWVVRSGDDLYVRSAYGPENGWFRRAEASGAAASARAASNATSHSRMPRTTRTPRSTPPITRSTTATDPGS